MSILKHGCLQTIVTAAGNSFEGKPVYDYPALFGGPSNSLSGLIVVGSVDQDGQQSAFSGFGDQVTAWAPGGSIPSESLTDPDYECSGTSCATALVSGLVAYLLTSRSYGPYIAAGSHDGTNALDAFGYTGPNVQKIISKLARKISSDGAAPAVVYNGVAGDPLSGAAAVSPSPVASIPSSSSSSSSMPQTTTAAPSASPAKSPAAAAPPPDPNAGCSKDCLNKLKNCTVNGKVDKACLTATCDFDCGKGCAQCS